MLIAKKIERTSQPAMGLSRFFQFSDFELKLESPGWS
jgi:hypothetical protein